MANETEEAYEEKLEQTDANYQGDQFPDENHKPSENGEADGPKPVSIFDLELKPPPGFRPRGGMGYVCCFFFHFRIKSFCIVNLQCFSVSLYNNYH